MEKEKKEKAIDLFAGCGGFTLGIAKAGFDVVGHVEYSEHALQTYEANKERGGFANSELIGHDITKITDEEILAFKKKHGKISLIVGGPPCQSFSMSGKREIDDPRDNLFLHFVRFVKIIQPDFFILENVPGLLSKKNKEGKFMIDIIQEAFKLVGYKTEYAVLNAVNYVVPQSRRRVMMFGTNKDIHIPFPMPITFSDEEGKFDPINKNSQIDFKCVCCGKYYRSYRVTKNKEKQCLFCYEYEKIDSPIKELGLKGGHIAMHSNVPVPAGVDDIVFIRFVEKRSGIFGVLNFYYTDNLNDTFICHWYIGDELRVCADNDEECDAAEYFIMAKHGMQFAENIK